MKNALVLVLGSLQLKKIKFVLNSPISTRPNIFKLANLTFKSTLLMDKSAEGADKDL